MDGGVLRARLQRARQDRERLVRAGVRRATSSNDEPSPGIAYEYRLVKQLLPGITAADASALARSLLADDSRVILATSPQKAGIQIPTEAELQAALGRGRRRAP